KELPELDDEFAQLASEFDTIGELRDDVRNRMSEVRRMQQLSSARDKALEKLIEQIDLPLPDAVVDEEIDRRRQSLEQQLGQSGLSKEAYLESQEKTEEEFEEELKTGAGSAVKAGFILDQLALQEDLSADQSELSQYVFEQAQRMGVSPDQLAQHLVESNQIRVAFTEVVRGKAMDLVLANAKITDEDGNVVEQETASETEEAAKAAAVSASEASDESAEAAQEDAEESKD